VFGDAHTHDRLVRELAVGTDAAVVFPEYDRSPEARYPVAIEQNYAVAQWVVHDGAAKGLDATGLAVAGVRPAPPMRRSARRSRSSARPSQRADRSTSPHAINATRSLT
jgi:hypothetical protein